MAAYGQVARSGRNNCQGELSDVYIRDRDIYIDIGNEASNERALAKAKPGMETEVTRVRGVRRLTAPYSQACLPQKPSADNDRVRRHRSDGPVSVC